MRRAMTCKRLAAFGVAVIMAAGAVTGCGGKKEETAATAAGGGAATASTEAGGVSEAGSFTDYSAGFPENVTIKIPVYDRGFEG